MKLDLDVDSPDKALAVIRNAVEAFYASAQDLEEAWQDKAAGRPWQIIAYELQKALERIERKGI